MLPSNIPQCQHIQLSGVRCGSPALRGQTHCYYHSVLRQKRENIVIPQLDEALNIQFSLRQIIHGIAFGQWDTKRAALLLYALQIASSNMRLVEAELLAAQADAVTEMPAAASHASRGRSRPSAKKAAAVAKKSPHRARSNATTNGSGALKAPLAAVINGAAAAETHPLPIASAADANGGISS
jgi:hypothetical protein